MKIDLSTDINNIAYLSYMKEQEEKTKEPKEDQKKVWYWSDRPKTEKEK